MEFKTGDLVTARVKSFPLIYHKAIAFMDDDTILFFHNTPDYENKFGGNITIETPEDFFHTRTFIKKKATNISKEKILKKYQNTKHKKFSLFTYNCEHFVTDVIYDKSFSLQLILWTIFLTLVVFSLNNKLIIINK